MIECCCSGFIIIGIYGFVTSIIRTERVNRNHSHAWIWSTIATLVGGDVLVFRVILMLSMIEGFFRISMTCNSIIKYLKVKTSDVQSLSQEAHAATRPTPFPRRFTSFP